MADTIGARIKARRLELGYSQDEVAKKLGYKSRSTINKIELGINDITQSKVVEFARALETTVPYLMGWDENNPPVLVDEGIWKTICADSAKLRLVTWIAGLDQETFSRMEKILDAAFDV